jgi:hypothetical protein
MMTPKTMLMGGEQRFVTVVFRGDAAAPDRLWVCVRGEESRSNASWAGCWSCSTKLAAADIRQFLQLLNEKVTIGGQTGPFGPYLDDHYYFDGWDSWGSGIPSPLSDIQPAVIVADAERVSSLDDIAASAAE